MQIKYQTYTMHLKDLPLDLGYMSERVTISSPDGENIEVGGHTGVTQLLITLPFLNHDTLKELEQIQDLLPEGGDHKVETTLILANKPSETPQFHKIRYAFDNKEEFADFYSLRLCGAPFEGELAKAITLISKDGALFYDEICDDLMENFDYEKLTRKIFAAQNCYTGKGCH